MKSITTVFIAIVLSMFFDSSDNFAFNRSFNNVEAYIFPSDSIRRDTLQLYEYYDFIQYYDSSRLVWRFGEVFIHRQSGVIWNPGLAWFNYKLNRPLYNNSLTEIKNLSGTNPFPFISGDTLHYYWTFQEMGEYDQVGDWINIQDTIIFYLDLINGWNQNFLVTIDSLGVLPHKSKNEWLTKLIHKVDTALVRKYILPEFGDSVKLCALRMRPVFMGNRDRLSISRWDFFEQDKISDKTIWIVSLIRQEIDRLVDSIVSIPKSKHILTDNVNENENYSITITTDEKDDKMYSFEIKGMQDQGGTLKIYSGLGQVVSQYNVSPDKKYSKYTFSAQTIPNGSYFAALIVNGKIVSATKFIITK